MHTLYKVLHKLCAWFKNYTHDLLTMIPIYEPHTGFIFYNLDL